MKKLSKIISVIARSPYRIFDLRRSNLVKRLPRSFPSLAMTGKKLTPIGSGLTKKTILAILAIVVIGVPLLYLTVLNQREAKASWMDENWRFHYA